MPRHFFFSGSLRTPLCFQVLIRLNKYSKFVTLGNLRMMKNSDVTYIFNIETNFSDVFTWILSEF